MASAPKGLSIPIGHGHGFTSPASPSGIKSPLEASTSSPGTVAVAREVDESAEQAEHAHDERVSNLLDKPRRSAAA